MPTIITVYHPPFIGDSFVERISTFNKDRLSIEPCKFLNYNTPQISYKTNSSITLWYIKYINTENKGIDYYNDVIKLVVALSMLFSLLFF